MGTIRDHMGVALVSSLAELIVGYYNASPSSELLDSASTVGHDLRKKMSENTHKIKSKNQRTNTLRYIGLTLFARFPI